MTEPLFLDTIERLARGLFAQLSPLTGERATGAASITALAGGPQVLPANSYLAPIIGGQLREDLLLKVAPDPTTTAPDGTGGGWEFTSAQTRAVAVKSNLGGARHNLALATPLVLLPALSGFQPTAEVATALTGGADGIVKSAVVFEELRVGSPEADVFASRTQATPSLMLTWQTTQPAEGQTVGMNQGNTRLGRDVRAMQETFDLSVIAGDLTSDYQRRKDGLLVLQAATRLLSDCMRNIDGEVLSSVGSGVKIGRRYRVLRNERLYVYGMTLSCNQTLQPIDSRTFNAWLKVRLRAALPGREAPEPTAPLTIVDVQDVIPPGA